KRLDDANPSTSNNPLGGGDPAVAIRVFGCWIYAFTGYLDRAEHLATEGVAIAVSTTHMPTRVWAMQMKFLHPLLRGEYVIAREAAIETLTLGEQFGFKTRIATSLLALGEARVMIGEVEEGLKDLRQGYDLRRSACGKYLLSQFATGAADNLLHAGQI